MRQFLAAAVLMVISVLGAHALAFFIIGTLPEPAVAALGIQSAQPAARAAFGLERPQRTYRKTLIDLAHGDLGTTLDNVAVSTELADASAESLPRIVLACALVALVVLVVAYAPRRLFQSLYAIGSWIGFMPPFVAPFIGLGVLLAVGWAESPAVDLLAAVCLAVPAAAFAAAQTAAITTRNLSLPFAVTIRAVGASRLRLRTRLLRNLIIELAPSLEKLAVGIVTALLFVESILGLGGLGTVMLRAIRRSDADMILAMVLVLALAVNMFRVLSAAIRQQHGLGAL